MRNCSPAFWEMGLPQSTFYDAALVPLEKASLLARISVICDEFECYGYRRVGAALRHQSVVVNGKKLRRLMREHALPRRWVVERSFAWLTSWGGLLHDRAGRLDVSEARLHAVFVLAATKALINPA